MSEKKTHISVLYQESLDALDLKPGKTVVDCTFGAGGHSLGIAEIIGKKGTLISFDQDAEVFTKDVVKKISSLTNFISIVSNFRDIEKKLLENGITSVDGVLMDLGLSSTQLEVSGRGFSFQKDEPLYMTFSDTPQNLELTAEVIVNEWAESSIADILYGFADETFSRMIAKAIVSERTSKRITSTAQLAEIINKAVPAFYRNGRINAATKTFQALRIAVNDELGSITEGVNSAYKILNKGGRLAVISFHSIEDRLVKNTVKELAENLGATKITKKPIVAGEEELNLNPRSRSAKLRVIEKS